MVRPANRLSGIPSSDAAADLAALAAEFERLFAEAEAEVRTYIFAILPNWANAEDVLQRTRIVLWRKFADFRAGSNFGAWARQIARFEVKNFRRTQRRDRHQFGDELIESIAEMRGSMTEELEQRRAILQQCVDKLAASDRQIIRHCYGPNATTTKAAADRLRRPVNTLYKALNRIRRTLMDCVQQTRTEGQKT